MKNTLHIIGAGFPRTGTTSLKNSLEILGFNKCYHMKELLVDPDQLSLWLSLEKTGTTDWNKLYDGYQATVDFPGYPFYKEHMKKYPDALVILTIRPFEKWYTSAFSTVWTAGPQNLPEKVELLFRQLFNPRLRKVIRCIKFVKRALWGKQFQGRFKDKAFAEKIFNQHIADVKAFVPPEKLLIYDVSEGWKPLCDFLKVPEPSNDFPHLNKKENFKIMLANLMDGKMV